MALKRLNRSLVETNVLPEKVLQFGEGNFLRAFVNWCIETMNKKGLLNAGVVVVQPIEQGLVEMLNEQDGLYTLYLNGIKKGEAVSEHQVIDCITRGLNPYSQYAEYLKTAENPEMEFVISNTTEAGITFKGENPAAGETPESFPGKLTAWLKHRFEFFNGTADKGVTIIPCELINHNGKMLKENILKYAEHWQLSDDFKKWIEESCSFYNTLVDRIVPGYPREKAAELCEQLGYEDKLIVEGEQFHLWVIEGPETIKEKFPADIAGLNVIFTDNQAPYRSRKVRILNGAHTSMVPVGLLAGEETVKNVLDNKQLTHFVESAIFNEIVPTLDLNINELNTFANEVLDRFRNPYVKHFLLSISLNSHAKYNTRILPSVIEYQKRKGELPRRLVFALAALIQLFRDKDGKFGNSLNDDKEVLALYKDIKDNNITDYSTIVDKVFGLDSVWNGSLNQIEGLKEMVVGDLKAIDEKGINLALQEI
ncbi:MAG: altronate oxidoreductase [Thalassobius sp.]|nr:altronate oxidoreductase [Thalassovita sp.]